jgi:PPM family protein phosphatase
LRIGALTDSGVVREKNEDSFSIIRNQDDGSVVIIVADGMGGHRAGGMASKLTCDMVEHEFQQRIQKGNIVDENIEELLKQITEKANRELLDVASKDDETKGMGTTLTVMVLAGHELIISHVGDSRVYFAGETGLEQITVDHSYVQELLDNGTITWEEALTHPSRNVITRAIGGDQSIDTDIYRRNINPKEMFLACTDGLTNMLTDEEIYDVIQGEGDVSCKAKALIDLANNKGGTDNITVVLVQLD